MLDPWIIEEIQKKEDEERRRQEEQRREQPSAPADDPREMPERRDDREMPVERKPGYEMPNPNETGRPPVKKDESKDEPRRGVDISRITGVDDDAEEDDGLIVISIKDLPALPKDDRVAEKPEEKPEKKPD